MLLYLQALYLLAAFLFTVFIKLSIGLPVKDILMLVLFGLLFIAYNRTVVRFLNCHMSVLVLFAALAITGILVTISNGRPANEVFNSFLSTIVQPFLVLSCTYVLTQLSGIRFTAGVFIGMALLTGVVAILQFAGIHPAWAIRQAIARIQSEPRHIQAIIGAEGRPMGLSLTPIVFSYHIASAYVAASLLHRFGYLRDGLYMALAVALLAAAAANATRSLVIGIILHEIFHRFMKLNLKSLIWLAVIAAVAMTGYSFLQTSSSRVVSFDDASALGRIALYKYGLLLARDNPMGLGWGFDPTELAWLYWENFAGAAKAASVFHLKLHNAFINFFLTYGTLGLLVIAFAFYINMKKFLLVIATFAAYFVHAMFHNNLAFLGDFYFWYAFGLLLYVCDEQEESACDQES